MARDLDEPQDSAFELPEMGLPDPAGPAKGDGEPAGSAFREEAAGSGKPAAAPQPEPRRKPWYRKKENIAVSVAVVAVPALVFGIAGGKISIPDWNSQTEAVAVDTNHPAYLTEEQVNGGQFWFDDKGKLMLPVSKADVELVLHGQYEGTEEQQKKLLRDSYSSTEVRTASTTLPSRAAGFTSDPAKYRLKDGTINPMYSYVVAEDVQDAAYSYIERLINPFFGGWTENQYPAPGGGPAEFSLAGFTDMFDSSYVSKNLSKAPSSWIPIYADWKGNDYGMGDKLLEGGPRWVGKIVNSKTTTTYDSKTLSYKFRIVADIEYSAWAKDQTVLKKKGVLTMDLITNKDAADTNHKLLISGLTQKVS